MLGQHTSNAYHCLTENEVNFHRICTKCTTVICISMNIEKLYFTISNIQSQRMLTLHVYTKYNVTHYAIKFYPAT